VQNIGGGGGKYIMVPPTKLLEGPWPLAPLSRPPPPIARGWEKLAIFVRRKSPFISEMVQDRPMITMEH